MQHKVILALVSVLFSLNLFAQEVRFDHNAILVKDLDESTEFYREVIGLEEVEDMTEQPHIRWFSMGSGTLHVIQDSDFELQWVKGIHLALRVTDLDGFIAKIIAKKIPFENWYGKKGNTNKRPDGIRQIYLQDPNGYWLEINGE